MQTKLWSKEPAARDNSPLKKQSESQRPFGSTNYICMAICLILIVLGFALMAGPGSSVEEGFNPDIFSTRRIVVGPTIAFIGFLAMAFAIIIPSGASLKRLGRRKPKQEKERDGVA